MKGDQFFWAAPKSSASDPEAFEPAQVDFAGERPDQVWFAGMDTEFNASDCVIAERIVRQDNLAPDLAIDDLRIIVIALRKAAHTSHPDMATRERELAYRIAQRIPPPFTPEEVEPS